MKRTIYLDHNSTTPLLPEALEAMTPYLTTHHGNASSLHRFGREARDAIEVARDTIADLIGARSSEVIFTSGGTESNNFALCGAMAGAAARDRLGIVTTAVEHHAVLETAEALGRTDHPLTVVGVDSYARVDTDALDVAVGSGTAIVSVMHANNETGTIQPIREAASLAHARGALFHTDAVQTVGKAPVDVKAAGMDLLSLSAHKFGGPKGVGALYIRHGTPIARFHHGGAHERNLRAGTENVAGIVGMARALEVAHRDMDDCRRLAGDLASAFVNGLRDRVDGVRVNSPEDALPGTVNASFEGVEGESLVLGFDLEGICLSTGSACASGSMEPSHVVQAMGLGDDLARGTLRFSFGRGNTAEDVSATLDALERLVARCRRRAATG
ncbi:cysteine desulfurase [Candidatus Poribacteria bacterium]|nr:cysteine desulfurase [Candidatus Poribacteria bacterium]MBT5536948.1 cysteine desulfurase [Candidatus Poribacteria bacterium]MBT7101121.1 cysteine desulfurase [Candidatus Poribacteria bacterium]MBT7808531.1 cysteine desulfurase [Candidatus Poribacteria bacterium]